jgi:uncharacterized repeat protein (TIGR02543 family)
MQVLRIAVIFIFAALALARAQCPDFEVFVNENSAGCGSEISLSTIYGSQLALKIEIHNGANLIWQVSGGAYISSTVINYTPDLSNNANDTFVYTLKAEADGSIKTTITLNLKALRTVSFNAQSGTASFNSKNIADNEPVGDLPTATKTGHAFNGWFTAASGGTQIDATRLITSDETFYAQWTAETYTITFDPNSGNVSPASKTATYNSAVGELPTPTRAGYEFQGWFASEGTQYTAATVYLETSDITLYAQWEFIKGTIPTAAMLDYALPANLTYTGYPINEITATPKSDIIGTLGNIKVLYNDKETPPTDAGIYLISAHISESEHYNSATVSLGSINIAKASVALSVLSATAKPREYNGTTTAEIDNIVFSTGLFSTDQVSKSDYSINATFSSPDVGENIPISIIVNWLPTGPLYKNYNLATAYFDATSANITQAIGELKIIKPETYELSNPVLPIATYSPFIKDSDIIWEYRKEGNDVYSKNLPNSVGNWIVKASFLDTDNYTGASDFETFSVTRGSAAIIHNISFLDANLIKDTTLSSDLQHYYYYDAKGTIPCKIEKATIQINVIEPDIVFKKINSKLPGEPPSLNCDKNDYDYCKEKCEETENCDMRYYITLDFPELKPGLDTLIYSLNSNEPGDADTNILLIERPILFDSIVKPKWKNVLFVNNNKTTNGGYEFTDYKWFRKKEGKEYEEVSLMQFYSAGQKATDTLNINDKYYIQMHYVKDDEQFRISSCEGSPKPQTTQDIVAPKATKQVLGINNKTVNPNAKIYNSKGEKTNGLKPGVYIVTE